MDTTIKAFYSDYVILNSDVFFIELQKELSAISTYEQRLKFWEELDFFKTEFLKRDEPYKTGITNASGYEALKSGQEPESKLSILPENSEERFSYFQWLINLPDIKLAKELAEIKSYPPKTKNMVKQGYKDKLSREVASDEFFRIAYLALTDNELENFYWHYMGDLGLLNSKSNAIAKLRYARHLYLINCELTEDENPFTVQVPDKEGGFDYANSLQWTGNKTELMLLIRAQIEAGLIKTNGIDIFQVFGAIYGIDLSNHAPLLSQVIHNRKGLNKFKIFKDLTSGIERFNERLVKDKEDRDTKNRLLK